MEQMLTIHITCSQLAVHYSDFQLKVTLKFRLTTTTRQWDSAMHYTWRPTGGNDKNHEKHNQLLD